MNDLPVLLRPLDGEPDVGDFVPARVQLSFGFSEHHIHRQFVNDNDIKRTCFVKNRAVNGGVAFDAAQ